MYETRLKICMRTLAAFAAALCASRICTYGEQTDARLPFGALIFAGFVLPDVQTEGYRMADDRRFALQAPNSERSRLCGEGPGHETGT